MPEMFNNLHKSRISFFANDMNYHIVNSNFDHSCWHVLHNKFLNWVEELTDLAALNTKFPLFLDCIGNVSKFKNYLTHLKPHQRTELIREFLSHSLPKTINTTPNGTEAEFYNACANAFDLNFYKIDHYRPSLQYISKRSRPLAQLPLLLGAYLSQLKDKNSNSFFEFIDHPASYKIIPQKIVAELQSYAPNASVNQDLQDHINLLFKLKSKLKNSTTMDNAALNLQLLPGLNAQELQIIEQWFPAELAKQTSANGLTIINFALNHLLTLKANLNSTFLTGKFPKNVELAKKLFKQLSTSVEAITSYENARTLCALIGDKTLRENFTKLLDQVFIMAARERVISKRLNIMPEYINCLCKLGFLAREISQGKPPENAAINSLFADLKTSSTILEGRRHGCLYRGIIRLIVAIRNFFFRSTQDQIVLPGLDSQSVSNQAIALEQNFKNPPAKPNLLLFKDTPGQNFTPASVTSSRIDNVVAIRSKTEGAKNDGEHSGYYTLQNQDGSFKTLLIKQGEPLSELLAYFEMQQGIKAGDFQHAAVTNLVLDNDLSTTPTLNNFYQRVYVASEFNPKSTAGIEAFKLGLYDERPRAADSLHGGKIFNGLIELDKQCKLGLGQALHNAFRTGDYDIHSGNVVLSFETSHITDNQQLTIAQEAIAELQSYIAQQSTSAFNHLLINNTSYEAHWKVLADKITNLQALGVNVFFQKIDHGLAYFHYGSREGNLTSSSIATRDGFFTSGGSTNHQAEWTADKRGAALLNEQFCKVIADNSPQKMETDKRAAASQFFNHIAALANKQFGTGTPEATQANLQLLNILHKHITKVSLSPTDFIGADPKQHIIQIQNKIVASLCEHGNRIAEKHDRQYLEFLQQIPDKKPYHTALENTLTARIKDKPLAERVHDAMRDNILVTQFGY